MREIVRAEAWRGFRELVEELGGDPAGILAAAGVDDASLFYPDRYLPLRWIVDSIEIAAKRLGRPDFGLLLGFQNNMSVLGALAIAASNASTARAGLEVIGRYIHVHNPTLTLVIAPLPGTTRDVVYIDFQSRSSQSANQYLERGVASIHGALRVLCGTEYRPAEVWFRNDQISSLHVYRKLFGVTPSFGKESLGVVIERATLDASQPERSVTICELAQAYLRSLGPPRDDTLSLRVAGLVRGLLLNGECSSQQAARALAIHERTLQRRLQAEGASFEQIKDEVRRELAEGLLAQPDVSVTHIAYVLGYADSSAFSRSVRRWFAESPSAHRIKLQAVSEPKSQGASQSRIRAAETAVLVREEERSLLLKQGRLFGSKP